VPFGCLAVAVAVVHLIEGNSGWRRTLAVEYVVLVALAFAFFYPIFAFYPLSDHAQALRFWLASWR
jgi:dolichyl-phosphate-mannose--protein O-mannosyl transferase